MIHLSEKLKEEVAKKVQIRQAKKRLRWSIPDLDPETYREMFWQLASNYHYNITKSKFVPKIPDSKQFRTVMNGLYFYLKNPYDWKGLFLFGNYGTGKTMAVYILAEMLKSVYPKMGYKLVTAREIIQQHIDAYANKNNVNVNLLETVSLLIIDDLGQEDTDVVNFYGNKIRPLNRIIEERHKNGRLTWFTSNWHPADLSTKYSEYIVDRIRQMCHFYAFNWESFRE